MSELSKKSKTVRKKTVKQAKPARKSGAKSRTRSAAKPIKAKKPAQSQVKRAKSTAKKTRQVRKPVKQTKTVRKSVSKKPQKRAQTKKRAQSRKKHASKRKFNRIIRKLSSRLLLVAMVIAGVSGFYYGRHMGVNGYVNALNNHAQATRAPSRITTPGPAQDNPHFSKYPTWSQNFATDTSGKLDSRYWNIYKGAPQNNNEEAQYYTDDPANIHIKDGSLSLVATRQKQSNNYASARVDTEKKLSYLYGRVDVTAKLPKAVGTSPAVWFLPANNKYRDLSSQSDSLRYLNGGEIDLVESVGFNPNIAYGVVHTRSDQKNHPDGIGSFDQVEVPNNDKEYVTYSMLWTPTTITLEVNNTPFFTYDKPSSSDYSTWPFDQPFYMIINLAMGGIWAGEDTAHFPGNGIDNSALPASMDIKSIYYYPYDGSNGSRN